MVDHRSETATVPEEDDEFLDPTLTWTQTRTYFRYGSTRNEPFASFSSSLGHSDPPSLQTQMSEPGPAHTSSTDVRAQEQESSGSGPAHNSSTDGSIIQQMTRILAERKFGPGGIAVVKPYRADQDGLPRDHQIDSHPFQERVIRNYVNVLRAVATRVLRPIDPYSLELQIRPTSKIVGVTYEPVSGDIFAADRDGHEILRFSGQLVLKGKFPASLPGTLLASFSPTGIVCDPTHARLLVTDRDNHRICFFSYDGQLLGTFGRHGGGNGEFNFPWGVAVSRAGDLIVVADSKNHRIQLFSDSGYFLRKFALFEPNSFEARTQFDLPRGICFDNTGQTIYVSDVNVQNVFAVDVNLNGTRAISQSPHLRRPQGLAVDEGGNILICDSANNVIRVVRQDGSPRPTMEGVSPGKLYSTVVGCVSYEPFRLPLDVCICREGYVCAVDLGGSRLRIF